MSHELWENLVKEISCLTREIREHSERIKKEFEWIKSHIELSTKHGLKEMELRIMSAISDFAKKQTECNNRQEAAITAIANEVDALNVKVAALQASAGTVTPEDQALINDVEAKGNALADKLDALAGIKPPTPPTA